VWDVYVGCVWEMCAVSVTHWVRDMQLIRHSDVCVTRWLCGSLMTQSSWNLDDSCVTLLWVWRIEFVIGRGFAALMCVRLIDFVMTQSSWNVDDSCVTLLWVWLLEFVIGRWFATLDVRVTLDFAICGGLIEFVKCRCLERHTDVRVTRSVRDTAYSRITYQCVADRILRTSVWHSRRIH